VCDSQLFDQFSGFNTKFGMNVTPLEVTQPHTFVFHAVVNNVTEARTCVVGPYRQLVQDPEIMHGNKFSKNTTLVYATM
jgi:hypothetical protein